MDLYGGAGYVMGMFNIPSIANHIYIYQVGVLEHLIPFHRLGIIISTDSYFSQGLKPPTRYILICKWRFPKIGVPPVIIHTLLEFFRSQKPSRPWSSNCLQWEVGWIMVSRGFYRGISWGSHDFMNIFSMNIDSNHGVVDVDGFTDLIWVECRWMHTPFWDMLTVINSKKIGISSDIQ